MAIAPVWSEPQTGPCGIFVGDGASRVAEQSEQQPLTVCVRASEGGLLFSSPVFESRRTVLLLHVYWV